MSDDTTRLAVAIEANTKQFENAIKKLEKATGQSLRGVNDNAKETARAFDTLSARVKTASGEMSRDLAGALSVASGGTIAGALLGGGLAGAVALLKDTSRSLADLGAEAKKAGLSVERFQELKYVSAQNVVGLDAMTDGIKELQLRADEWIVTGAGPGAEAFQRLGYSADDLSRKLKDPSNLFVEIIGRLSQLDRAAQLRVLDEVFGGTGGEQFVGLVDAGEKKIREQIKAARELGLIFDQEIIARATETNAKFDALAEIIKTRVQRAVLDVADVIQKGWRLVNLDPGDLADQIKAARVDVTYAEQMVNSFLSGIAGTREEWAQKLAEARARLAELEAAASGVKKPAEDAGAAVSGLGGAFGSTGSSAAKAGANIRTFAEGVAALSKEIPDLAQQLADLDARTRIEDTYKATVTRARTMGEVQQATALRNEALAALDAKPAREAAGGGLLDLIGYAEGTDKGRRYNETLGYGAFAGGPVNLTGMTLDEVDALQGRMLAHPDNTYNSSAVGRYQITRTTLRGLRERLGLAGDSYYSPELQDRLALELARQRGPNPDALRNEWEGLRRVDDATIMASLNGTNLPPVDEAVTRARTSGQDVDSIFARAATELERMQAEAGKGADEVARLRYEAQLFDDVARARGGDGLVTEEDLARIRQAGADYAAFVGQASQARQALAGLGEDFTQGIAGDLMAGADAADAFAGAFKRLLAQLASSEISSLFATLGGQSGTTSILSTILGGLLNGGGGGGGGSGPLDLLAGVAGRAGGGSVNAGQPYVVGERRPELFVPASAGRIAQLSELRAPKIAAPRSGVPSAQPVTVRMSVDLTGANGDAAIQSAMEQAAAAGAARAISASNAGARGRTVELNRYGR